MTTAKIVALTIVSFAMTLSGTDAFELVMHGSAAPRRPPKVQTLGRYSQSLPFLVRPPALDGTYAGDVGFDPLNFARDKEWLLTYREAEIKHARLAMLAAAGWPLSELYDARIASFLGLPALLDDDGRVPSFLNGGLDKVPAAYWVLCLLFASAVDVYGLINLEQNYFQEKTKKDYVPGNYGLDPFGFTGENTDQKFYNWMALAEIKNGRVAMLGVTAYAILEFAQHKSIVSSYDFLFQPLGQTVQEFKVLKGISY